MRIKRGSDKTHGNFDAATMRQSLAAPGMDPRSWVSYGIVDRDDGDTKAVEFDPDWGVLILVTLQPSGTPVRCRVGGSCAGAGESEYHPFVPGDEVIVVIPEGDERTGPVIVGRLNQKLDKFPTLVGGNDTTNNSVAFKRTVAPYVLESSRAIMLRVATPGSFISMSPEGNITLSAGDKGFVHVGADFIGMQSGDGTMVLQADLTRGEWRLDSQRDTAMTLRVGGDHPGMFSSDAITLSAGGQIYPFQHLLTLEQLIAILIPLMGQIQSGMAGWIDISDPGPVYAARSSAIATALTAAGGVQLNTTPTTGVAQLASLLSGVTPPNPVSGATGVATQLIA